MSERLPDIIQGFRQERGSLIPMLQQVQKTEKCLTSEAIAEISRYLDLSQNDVYSVASSYREFRFTCPE